MDAPSTEPGQNGGVPPKAPYTSDEVVDRVRRRLLKAGVYAAPFVATFGVFLESALAQATGCAPCQPNACPPVTNNCAPLRSCRPGRGG